MLKGDLPSMAPVGSANAPEARARAEIDRQLEAAGWLLQHRDEMNLAAGDSIACASSSGAAPGALWTEAGSAWANVRIRSKPCRARPTRRS
jgi:hypothetical protein